MNLSPSILEQIEKAASEGRVTEGGKPVLSGLMPPAGPVAEMSEKEFQQAVAELAKRNGWKHFHTFRSDRSEPGFPDSTLVRERVVWMELKIHPNKPTADQLAWIDALKAAGQSAAVYYPEDWQQIVNILQGVS